MNRRIKSFSDLIKFCERGYRITQLRVTKEISYAEIAEDYKISSARVKQLQDNFLHNLLNLYTCYLSKHVPNFTNICIEIRDFYQDYINLIAYFESTYDILKDFRNGFPPVLPIKFVPYKTFSPSQLSNLEKEIIDLRENHKLKYTEIGKKLNITKEKARETYHFYYHRLAWASVEILSKTHDDPNGLYEYVFRSGLSSKHSWDYLQENYLENIKMELKVNDSISQEELIDLLIQKFRGRTNLILHEFK